MTKSIKLSAPFSGGATVIPNTFFDIYMPAANGDFVKVYLYLIRRFQAACLNLSVLDIADAFNLTERDVVRALTYWRDQGLLKISSDSSGNVTDICLNPSDMNAALDEISVQNYTVKGKAPRAAAPAAAAVEDLTDALPSGSESVPPVHAADKTADSAASAGSDAFSSSPNGAEIMMVIEQYLGRPLSRTDTEKICYFHDTLGFPCDLIDYLFDYCASNGKRDIRYIEKVALGWAQQNIHTVKEAMLETELHQASSYAIMTEFGLGSRRPAPGELEYIRTWMKKYGFSLDMVLEACRRTIMAIHTPSFEYADKILRTWKKDGISTLQEAEAADSQRDDKLAAQQKLRQNQRAASRTVTVPNNRFNNFSQRSYNYGDIEKKLVQKSQKINDPDSSVN